MYRVYIATAVEPGEVRRRPRMDAEVTEEIGRSKTAYSLLLSALQAPAWCWKILHPRAAMDGTILDHARGEELERRRECDGCADPPMPIWSYCP